MLTVQELQRCIPPQTKIKITQEFTDKLNNIADNEDLCEKIRDNFISYTNILKDGKFKIEDYLNAVKFVTFILLEFNNKEAYMRALPDRYNRMLADGLNDKQISSFVASYRKNKLVNLLYEQTLIPTWLLNRDIHQKAINTLADLMVNARSEKVQCDAANNLLTHLKQPEKKEVQLNIGLEDNSGLNELKNLLKNTAQQQQQLIEAGASTKEVVQQKLMIDITPEDNNVN